MAKKEGRGSQLSADEVLMEADRLAGAKGPKRTEGGAGAYNAKELLEAIRSLKGRGGRQEKNPAPPPEPQEPVAKGGSLDAFAGNDQ